MATATAVLRITVSAIVFAIQGAHRAFSSVDSPQTGWVRDEAGPHNLANYSEIVVSIRKGRRQVASLPAIGGADGKLQFTVTAQVMKQRRLYQSVYELVALADGRVVYLGVLEAV